MDDKWGFLALVLAFVIFIVGNKPTFVIRLIVGGVFATIAIIVFVWPKTNNQLAQIGTSTTENHDLVTSSPTQVKTQNALPTKGSKTDNSTTRTNPCNGGEVTYTGDHINISGDSECHLVLQEGEIVFGTADRFQADVLLPEIPQPPCTAFTIQGPIEIDLLIHYGGWDYYTSVTSELLHNKYLEDKKAECSRNHPERNVKVIEIPEFITVDAFDSNGSDPWCASSSGNHIIRYSKGAYSPFSTDTGCDPQGCWKSTIFIYKNSTSDQIFGNSSKGEPQDPLKRLGWDAWQKSPEDVETSSKTMGAVNVELIQGDCLTFIAIDPRDAYNFPGPNRGKVILSIVSP